MKLARRSWLTVALILAPFVAASCKKSDEPPVGSGVGAKRTLELGGFTKLQVSGALEVNVRVGKREPLEIRGDDNLIPLVTARLEGDRLIVGIDRRVKKKQPLRVDVGTEALTAVNLAIAAKARIQGVKAEHFEVRAAGGSELVASGSSAEVDVATKSAARVDLTDFSNALAVVNTADASRVKLGHAETLKVTLTGLSQVRYRGDPTLEQHITRPARLIREN